MNNHTTTRQKLLLASLMAGLLFISSQCQEDSIELSKIQPTAPTSEITGSLTPVGEMTNTAPEVQSQAPRVVGKIYGVVTMEETGEPLPGANIVLEGTTMGAATDNNGQYFIINVPPGTYTLRASMLGFFESVAFGEVIVKVMESTEVNFSLKVIRLEGETKVAPSPPPPEGGPTVRFVPYDEAPQPIGGYAAIQQGMVYPEQARAAGIEGNVIVMAFINENGQVQETKILKGIPNTGLNEAALAAIQSVSFEPAKQEGTPVGVWISIPVNFRLNK